MRNGEGRGVRRLMGVASATALVLCGIALPSTSAGAVGTATSASGRASVRASAGLGVHRVGGGTWEYGVSGGKVWSKYQHPRWVHRSTACSRTSCGYSKWKSPTVLAVASHPKSLYGNTAYWDVR
ncbi:hypothetical protein GCM10027282_17550 [Frigoribacterium salinisoli]